MKLIIDTETLEVKKYADESFTPTTLADLFESHRGETEYDGVVATIQKWYYGSVVRSPWCATAVSYFAHCLGMLEKIGGKNENVNVMRKSCANNGIGTYYDKSSIPKKLLRGDILFWLWSGDEMTDTSSKHVGVCALDTGSDGIVYCIGGNQKNKICTLGYDRSNLYAVFRPDYSQIDRRLVKDAYFIRKEI